MKFHGIKCTYPGTVRSNLLYNCQFNVFYNLLDSSEQLDLYLNSEVARGYLVNKSMHYTDFCTTVESVPFQGMCTLPHEISFSFKKNRADLLNGYVQILVTKINFSHMIVHLVDRGLKIHS